MAGIQGTILAPSVPALAFLPFSEVTVRLSCCWILYRYIDSWLPKTKALFPEFIIIFFAQRRACAASLKKPLITPALS
jgi:hypothetical protein